MALQRRRGRPSAACPARRRGPGRPTGRPRPPPASPTRDPGRGRRRCAPGALPSQLLAQFCDRSPPRRRDSLGAIRVTFSTSPASTSPIAKAPAPLVASLPCGSRERERLGARLRQPVRARDQSGRADRLGHQHRGGDRRLPVLVVEEGDRRGTQVRLGRGVDRQGDACRVGGRVSASHPRRVAGREGRIAQLRPRSRRREPGSRSHRPRPEQLPPAERCSPRSHCRPGPRRRGRRWRGGRARRSPSAPPAPVSSRLQRALAGISCRALHRSEAGRGLPRCGLLSALRTRGRLGAERRR